MKRLRVGVIYGGRSGEHEVSLASAAAVYANLDRTKYEPVPILIDKEGRWVVAGRKYAPIPIAMQKEGRWVVAGRPPLAMKAADTIEQARLESGKQIGSDREVHLVARPSAETMLAISRNDSGAGTDGSQALVTGVGLDVIFPVLHGPYGEDGTVQGLLELANIPYVGCGVLASAVGMDKVMMKVVFASRGLPICDYAVVRKSDWVKDRDGLTKSVIEQLGFPVFVKPANLGSSVGISKAKDRDELIAAIDLAAEFDRKIIVEAGVPDAREIECSVLGNDDPIASIAGEVIPSREFYDYEAKYLDDASRTEIPADLTPGQLAEVQRLSREAFLAIDGSGLARVDFLLSRRDGQLLLNEVNTLPGFTTISMYGKLWEATGISYPELLDRLIALALERHAAKQELRTSAI